MPFIIQGGKRMKKKGKITGLGLGMVMLTAGAGFAAGNGNGYSAPQRVPEGVFDLAVGLESMAGDTTYQIGGHVIYADGSSELINFPVSQLEWPLDAWLGRIEAGLNLSDTWRMNGVIKKDISDPNDPMKDSDWLTLSDPGRLDVYSESNISDFSASIYDLDVEWSFFKNDAFSLYAGVGYLYQKFKYDSQLGHQYSPSGQPGFEYYGDGSVSITYEVTYAMPYFKVGTDFAVNNAFTVQGGFSWSSWVNADDEDRHLLRDRVTEADMNGYAYMIDLSGMYHFTPSWFVEGGFLYTYIDVDGRMDVAINGVRLGSEEEKSKTTQTSGYLTLGYAF